jgi:hypothetical protein
MKHRFLLHSLSHTLLAVDITNVGPSVGVYPRAVEDQAVPTVRFQSWEDAERYFLASGADGALIERTFAQLRETGVAVLTIT